MSKKARNGIYTTGKESFKVTVLDKIVKIFAINAVSILNLKSGEETEMNKESFDTFLDRELKHYFWHKE
jgi:hypothetical protein